jgi:hypothetical protein
MLIGAALLYFFAIRFLSSSNINRPNIIIAITCIAFSLAINISSGGYEGRMNGLPAFNLYQSVKNTIHSFLMPFLDYLYLPIFLGALVIYILFLKRRTHHYSKRTLWVFAVAALLCAISFFLNCFLLSDVVPARAALWAYTLAILTIGLFLVSDKQKA